MSEPATARPCGRSRLGGPIRKVLLIALFSSVTTTILANDTADLIFDDLSGRTFSNSSIDTKSIRVLAELDSNKLDDVPNLDSENELGTESNSNILSAISHTLRRIKRDWFTFPDLFSGVKKDETPESKASATEETSTSPLSASTASLNSETTSNLLSSSTAGSSLFTDLGEVSPLPSSRVARSTQSDFGDETGYPFSDSPDPNSNSDDEDFLKGGSGEDFPASGEISTNTPEVTEWSTGAQDVEPHFYRITIVVNEPYNEQYLDHGSSLFKQLAANLTSAIDEILHIHGQFMSNLIAVSPVNDMFFLKATVDIEAIDTHDKTVIHDTLYDIIRRRRKIGYFSVEEKDFTFRDFKTGIPGRPCLANQIFCVPSDSCLPVTARCNQTQECSDGSDELGCPTTIVRSSFATLPTTPSLAQRPVGIQCRGDAQHKCAGESDFFICNDQVCDGIIHCPQGDDEENCATPSPPPCNDFLCDSTRCIAQEQVCDRRSDCADGTDEDPKNCPCDGFRCDSTRCISQDQVCDRRSDCADGTDEDPRQCPVGCRDDQWTCRNGECIDRSQRCNLFPRDCSDGSDEEDCSCTEDQFPCANGQCIPLDNRCDFRRDCTDGSDELDCEPPTTTTTASPRPVACLSNEFRCFDGRCITRDHVCDNITDCSDGSDERNCRNIIPTFGLNLKTYPPNQVIKETREVVFQCRDEGPLRSKVRWVRGNGLPLPPGSRDRNGRLEIPDIKIQHSGTYICEAVDYLNYPNSRATVYLNVERIDLPPIVPEPPHCGFSEATCSNGECIPKSQVCNGVSDCSDGSDEMRCNQIGCEPNEFWCANKRCVRKTWRCDSEDDCGDGSDELNCAPPIPGAPCKPIEFMCRSGNQCTPRSFHCDGQVDCADGSDEIGCSPPIIRTPPPPMVILDIGADFTITCTAEGVPTPEISWRLNWGHIPAKCNTTSVNGVGVLKCPNVQESDQGAYSCEAMNSRKSEIAIPDTILTIRASAISSCPGGTFNDLATDPRDCINCFCFGVSTQCKSANLFTFQLPPPFGRHQIISVVMDPNYQNIDIRKNELSNYPDVQSIGRDGFQFRSGENNAIDSDNAYPYYAFPDSYLGNQLKSYGGYVKYSVRFLGEGSVSNVPDIIISGNGLTLVHVGPTLLQNRDNEVSVRFFRGSWIKSGFRNAPGGPRSIPASREEIMMVLADLQSILIRVQYVTGPTYETTITNIRMDSAGNRNTGFGKAAYVEECRCPAGYSGLSCETCAAGYNRRSSGPWLGQCYREEQACLPGTYGDPSRGIPCRVCPCPLANSVNQFGRTCHLDTDGQVTCDCPPEYTGRRCEKCAAGYSGNPLVPGDSCRQGYCDAIGSQSLTPNPTTGQCICKDYVTGSTCNICQNNTFHLSSQNQFGCISCFCMGHTDQCSSSNWYRNQVSSAFVTSSTQEFKLAEYRDITAPIRTGFDVNPNTRELIYRNFFPGNQEVFYWMLPPRFLGDKVTSYGGYLNYTLRYVPAQGGQSSRNSAPDVEIMSANNIRLMHFQTNRQIQPNRVETVSVPLLEQYWQRQDGQKTNREHLMMALADLVNILIKATYTTNTEEVALTSVSLDIAESRNTGQPRALEVEQCSCPPGHTGLSCEDCDVGFTRQEQGLYLGICEPCACNGHSEQCDPESGVCQNCRDHTTGENCNICEDGYIGRPDRGEPCLVSGNQELNQDCNCDPRGSISTDCLNGLCTCKRNVEGVKCDRCRPGTFDLSASHVDGCLSCYCSGVSNTCQSASLYLTQIPMELISEDHGITLTDANRNEVIRDGFDLNVPLSQIGYVFKDDNRQSKRLFWSLPTTFTGNKLTSYGGNLTFTRHYSAGSDNQPIYDQDVIISGKGLTIYWSSQSSILPDTPSTDIISLEETNWKRLDEQKVASRADMLKVLSSVEAILIRASLGSGVTHTYLSDVMMDIAVRQNTGQSRATQIESCRCPPAYDGHSCESCKKGHYQDQFGTCSKCPCNDREESCALDYNRQVVCQCQYGWTGQFCQRPDSPQPPPPRPTERPEPPPPATIFVSIAEPKIQIVAVGSSVQFKCYGRSLITGRPLSVTWSRENARLPAGAIETADGTLILSRAQEADSGTYICSASDDSAIIYDRATLSVGGSPAEPPQVAIFPRTLEVRVGDEVEFTCRATGNPTPVLEWTGSRTLNPQHTFQDGVFRIPFAKVSDEGTYQCRATSAGGSDITNVVLRVTDDKRPEPPVVIVPSGYNGPSGASVNFTCDVVDRNQYSVLWTRGNNQPLPLHAIQSNGVLLFSNISVADNGVYRCTATSFITGQVLQTVDMVINVYPFYPQSPVRIEPRSQTVPQGTPAELRCIVDGNVAVKWAKRGTTELPSYMQVNGPILRIPSVVLDDRGVYICEVEFRSNLLQKAAATLEVERREAPIVSIIPKESQTAREGSSVMLYCEIKKGEPRPVISWSRTDGRPLSRNIEVVSPEFLRFTSISTEEEGEYECKAENKAGVVTALASIVVQIPPKITISPSRSLSVRPGERVHLECTAEGRPTPFVEWSNFLGSPLRPSLPSGQRHTAYFDISEATTGDSGTHTCRATNEAGVVEEQVELFVSSDGNEIPNTPGRGDIIGQDPGSSAPGPAFFEHESAASEDVLIIAENGDGELRCNTNNPAENSVVWIKGGSDSLPSNVETRGARLIIRGARQDNAGDYICYGTDGNGRPFEMARRLEVKAPPRIVLRPVSQTVRPGDFARINCSAVSGDEPMYITWVRDYNKPLHPAVVVGNDLLFYGITVNDTGRYVCQARNEFGQAEGVAEVIVDASQPSRPIITAEDRNVVAREGSSVTLRCSVQSAAKDYSISWVKGQQILRETGPTLQLWNIKPNDADRYACRVSSYRGSSVDYINLRVERIDISLNIESNLDIIHSGDDVELRCHVSGMPNLPVSWLRIGGTFDSNVVMSGSLLRLNNVQPENAGLYRCSSSTPSGHYVDYDLVVRDEAPVSANYQISKREVNYGANVTIDCVTNLEPPIKYSWIKQGVGIQNPRHKNSAIVNIPFATAEDAGRYICTASNPKARMEIPTVLTIRNVVPRFSGSSTYVKLPPLKNAYSNFTIEIVFKPEKPDGILLYTLDGTQNQNPDFVSLILKDGVPEFKFDLGSGPATVTGEPITLGAWHTILLIQNKKSGEMHVDNGRAFRNQSQGSFVGLDLKQPWYIGGVADLNLLQKNKLSSGFTGCISRLVTGGTVVDLMHYVGQSRGIESCDTCQRNPCLNQGICQEGPTSTGYFCICAPGFSGEKCGRVGETCYPGICGDGRCLNTAEDIVCQCPIGRAGYRCQEPVTVTVPSFNGDGFLAYPTPKLPKLMKLSMKINPSSVGDSILMYAGQSTDGSGDFTSLTISNGQVEFRFDTGSGLVVLRSNHDIIPRQWSTINLSRNKTIAMLQVANEAPVYERLGDMVGVDLTTPLYIGGFDRANITLNNNVRVYDSFRGCITDLSVSNIAFHTVKSVIDSANIHQCSVANNNICASSPCLHNGICYPTTESYTCKCPAQYDGDNCERIKNYCDTNRPCLNGGTCSGDASTFVCSCPLGYRGSTCSENVIVGDEISLNGNGYVELSGALLPHIQLDDNEIVEIEFSTSQDKGILLWHGQGPQDFGRNQDYFAIAIVNGSVELSYELGSGPVTIPLPERKVNDNQRHTVVVRRQGVEGSIELDGTFTHRGKSKGDLTQLNTSGNVFIGGLPNADTMTDGKYLVGLTGCIHLLRIQNSAVNIGRIALSGANVTPCLS